MVRCASVDKGSLRVGRMLAGVLERRGDDVVEKEFAAPGSAYTYRDLVHSLFGRALHVAVECDPGAAPSPEVEPVFEAAADAPLLAELEKQFARRRLRCIKPENEGRNAGLRRIGILMPIANLYGQGQLRSVSAPAPAQRVGEVFEMGVRYRDRGVSIDDGGGGSLLEGENPGIRHVVRMLCLRRAESVCREQKYESGPHHGIIAIRIVRFRYCVCAAAPPAGSSRRSSAARRCCCRGGCSPPSA